MNHSAAHSDKGSDDRQFTPLARAEYDIYQNRPLAATVRIDRHLVITRRQLAEVECALAIGSYGTAVGNLLPDNADVRADYRFPVSISHRTRDACKRWGLRLSTLSSSLICPPVLSTETRREPAHQKDQDRKTQVLANSPVEPT